MIQFSDVTASYELPAGGRRTVFEHLTMQIPQGEMVYLVGPSGCGKSTVLKQIYMDLLPESGSVLVNGFDSQLIQPHEIPYLRRTLGIVFQDFQLLADRSVAENVAFALYATGQRGRTVKRKVLEALTRVGLSYRRRAYPHELSGGEQQRVCIARAVVNEPPVLLADEPTGNLDPTVADGIQDLLVTLNRQGMTVIMATHNYHQVRRYPARTLAFVDEKLVEVDPESLDTTRTL